MAEVIAFGHGALVPRVRRMAELGRAAGHTDFNPRMESSGQPGAAKQGCDSESINGGFGSGEQLGKVYELDSRMRAMTDLLIDHLADKHGIPRALVKPLFEEKLESVLVNQDQIEREE